MIYHIKGNDFQYVELLLEPNEEFKSQPGAMMYMSPDIEMESKILDSKEGGFFSKLGGALKRVISGENLALAYFKNISSKPQKIAFSAEYAGKIIPLRLHREEFYLQPDAYLCSSVDIEIDISMTKISTGLFGGEGFILQKLKGTGIAFVNAGGSIEKIDLLNETILVDTGSLVGFSNGIDYNVKKVKGFKNILFSGEGFTLTELCGTGSVYIQSTPFKRFANKVYEELKSNFTQTGGERSADFLDNE